MNALFGPRRSHAFPAVDSRLGADPRDGSLLATRASCAATTAALLRGPITVTAPAFTCVGPTTHSRSRWISTLRAPTMRVQMPVRDVADDYTSNEYRQSVRMSSVGVLCGAALTAWEYGLPPGPCAYARVIIFGRSDNKRSWASCAMPQPTLPHVAERTAQGEAR